jgi:hypothetical protein
MFLISPLASLPLTAQRQVQIVTACLSLCWKEKENSDYIFKSVLVGLFFHDDFLSLWARKNPIIITIIIIIIIIII